MAVDIRPGEIAIEATDLLNIRVVKDAAVDEGHLNIIMGSVEEQLRIGAEGLVGQ